MCLGQSSDIGEKVIKSKYRTLQWVREKKRKIGFWYKVIEWQKSETELPQDGRSKNIDKSSSKIKCYNLGTLVFQK